MGRRRYSPPNPPPPSFHSSPGQLSSPLQDSIDESPAPAPLSSMSSSSLRSLIPPHSNVVGLESLPDEGFHEGWPPFAPSDLMDMMTPEQYTAFLKEWLLQIPMSCLTDIVKCIAPRLHKDFIKELPHELKYEVLSYLEVADLLRARAVSLSWLQICSYPLLWKRFYFEQEWTVDNQSVWEFESRLSRMQSQFDHYFSQLHPHSSESMYRADFTTNPCQSQDGPAGDLSRLYFEFFEALQSPSIEPSYYGRLKQLEFLFSRIARVEVGETFYRAATFTLNSNGSIRVHVNWHYLYVNRHLLEENWRKGRYQTEIIDGAPDVSQPNQREGHYCVYFDRFYLAAGSRDHTIRLWDMNTMQFKRSLRSHKASVLCLQLDTKRNMLVSGSSDSTIKIWDIEKGEVVQTLRGHDESVLGLQFEDKYIVSCSRDSTARIWALQDAPESIGAPGENCKNLGSSESNVGCQRYGLLHVLRGHRAAVNSVHIKSMTIATASGDRTVRLWDLATGAAIRTIGSHTRGIACVNVTGNFVVTGSSDHIIKVFDIETGEVLRTLRGHGGLVRTIQTDNTKIISGSYDQSIRIWDLKSGELLQELMRCHDSKIFRVHRDQRRIISCCGNARIVVWDFSKPPNDDSESKDGHWQSVDAAFF